MSNLNLQWLTKVWEVLVLFLIPIGGGIPAGVLVAQKHGLSWPIMALLYFISDVILACVFEPVMLLLKRFAVFKRLNEAIQKAKAKNNKTAGAAVKPSTFALIMISFGVDPMTGRTAALAAGHHFLSGWALAITGDMLFFMVLMVSTICLNNILGDGTWTAIIVMVAMIGLPALIRALKARRKAGQAPSL
jgi:hypothetical protein